MLGAAVRRQHTKITRAPWTTHTDGLFHQSAFCRFYVRRNLESNKKDIVISTVAQAHNCLPEENEGRSREEQSGVQDEARPSDNKAPLAHRRAIISTCRGNRESQLYLNTACSCVHSCVDTNCHFPHWRRLDIQTAYARKMSFANMGDRGETICFERPSIIPFPVCDILPSRVMVSS